MFQGRCHSCNISETPEWRRGPDGARTLCNACGLRKSFSVTNKAAKHSILTIDYAKLAKKKVKKDDDMKKETLEQNRDDTSMK